MQNVTNVAIVLAGGSGTRLGRKTPKQFLKINGKMVIQHSVETFSSVDGIHRIVVVVGLPYVKFTREIFRDNPKVEVVAGGEERCISSRNAIMHLQNNPPTNVLIHDAARPLISKDTIYQCLDALKTHKAVVVASSITQTASIVHNEQIESIPHRNNIYIHQTPQCFSYTVIKDALQNASINFTDDVSAVFYNTHAPSVKVVEGAPDNIKITTKLDIHAVKFLMKLKSKFYRTL